MKKIALVLVVILTALGSQSQPSLDKITRKYFRVNPLDRPFSTFLNQVLNDTSFIIDVIERRTDSNLFYLRGHYKNFSPYLFKTNQVQFSITEFMVLDEATQQPRDTVISFNMTATTLPFDVKKQRADVREEYQRFNRKNSKYFLQKNEIQTGSPDQLKVKQLNTLPHTRCTCPY
jgi:hypothetical protein